MVGIAAKSLVKPWTRILRRLPHASIAAITICLFVGRAHGVDYYTVTQIPNAPTRMNEFPGIGGITNLGANGDVLVWNTDSAPSGFIWNGSAYNLLPAPYQNNYFPIGNSMNASGTVVGYLAYGAGAYYLPAEWINGNLTVLNTSAVPGGSYLNMAGAINDAGMVAGYTSTNLFTVSPGGVVTNQGPMPTGAGPSDSRVFGINSSGQVLVGTGSGTSSGVWKNGTWTALKDVQGGIYSDAHAINNNGLMVGDSFNNQSMSQLKAVQWDANGTAYPLKVPGSSPSRAWDVNNLGQIVGQYDGAPCIWDSDGTYYPLSTLIVGNIPSGWTLANGDEYINDSGQIVVTVGSGTYFLSPTGVAAPEPASLLLLSFGTSALLLRRRNRASRYLHLRRDISEN